jgi:DNA topoisomerase-1
MALAYVKEPGNAPGFTRRRAGKGFSYRAPDGRAVRDRATIARFRALAIPPAWTDVWICADPDGHVQATGRDARGRLQYRYHPTWRARRDRAKYDKLVELCRALPALRRRVARDLSRDGVELDTVAAAVVALIERGYLRIGNVEYARDNGSYGATTLENRHLRLHGDLLELRYRGKSGVERHIVIDDGTLADVLRRVRKLPGTRLFQYERDGRVRAITSADVNRYLRAVIGEQFSAKDFRTWAATISCALRLAVCETPASDAASKRAIKAVIGEVAEQLGHTPAVCRASYLHPKVLGAFRDGTLVSYFPGAARTLRAFDAGVGRAAAEHALIALLVDAPIEQRLVA